jgi:hypothetical protein
MALAVRIRHEQDGDPHAGTAMRVLENADGNALGLSPVHLADDTSAGPEICIE